MSGRWKSAATAGAAVLLLGFALAAAPAGAAGAPATIEVEAIDKLISPTETLKVRATVLDENGEPVPATLVRIQIDTICNTRIGRIVTDEDGVANYHISGTQTACIGNAYVSAGVGSLEGNTDSARIFIDSQPVW